MRLARCFITGVDYIGVKVRLTGVKYAATVKNIDGMPVPLQEQ
jgi:hypothetical protein